MSDYSSEAECNQIAENMYRLQDIAYVDSVSSSLNDDIKKHPDSYFYINELMEEAIDRHELDLIKKVFQNVKNIGCIMDFPVLLTLTDSEEMVEFLYSEYLKFDDRMYLDILERTIKDLQEDNPNMFIINYHQKQKELGVWDKIERKEVSSWLITSSEDEN